VSCTGAGKLPEAAIEPMESARRLAIAASHAGCFAVALALQLRDAGYIFPTELTAETAVCTTCSALALHA